MQNGRPLSENCVWSQAEKEGAGIIVGDDQRRKVKLGAMRQKYTERRSLIAESA